MTAVAAPVDRSAQLEMFRLGPSFEPPSFDVGAVLSPTQVRTFMSCQARWYFKYVEKLPDPQNASLALGKAVHAAIGENFSQKIESKEDLPLAGVVSLYRDAWYDESRCTEFREDEEPDVIGKCGEGLVTKYMDEAAPLVEPAAVETPVAGKIGGVPVRGIVDVIDVYGTIIDLKTRCRKPSGISTDEAFQLATYQALSPGSDSLVRVDTLVKTKSPQFVQHTFDVDSRELQALETLYPLTQRAMQRGLYMPNRGSMLCSRRNCPFWRRCESEFGGRV